MKLSCIFKHLVYQYYQLEVNYFFSSHLQAHFLTTKLQFFIIQYFYTVVHHYQWWLYEPWFQAPMINKLYAF